MDSILLDWTGLGVANGSKALGRCTGQPGSWAGAATTPQQFPGGARTRWAGAAGGLGAVRGLPVAVSVVKQSVSARRPQQGQRGHGGYDDPNPDPDPTTAQQTEDFSTNSSSSPTA